MYKVQLRHHHFALCSYAMQLSRPRIRSGSRALRLTKRSQMVARRTILGFSSSAQHPPQLATPAPATAKEATRYYDALFRPTPDDEGELRLQQALTMQYAAEDYPEAHTSADSMKEAIAKTPRRIMFSDNGVASEV